MIIRPITITDRNPVIGWHNVVTESNITATTEREGFPATNLANPSTHLKWTNGANSPATDDYLTVSGFSQTISYVGIAQHNFGSTGSTLTIQKQTSSSPSDWNTVIGPEVITDDEALIFQFPEIANATGIRVRIQASPSVDVEAAVLYIGNILTLERSLRIDMNHTPVNLATVSDVISGMSESGQFLGRTVRRQYRETKADFWYFENDFYRDEFDLFIRNAVDKPFFFAWAPADSPINDYPTDTGYCWLIKDPKPEFHLPTERFIVSLEMRGLA